MAGWLRGRAAPAVDGLLATLPIARARVRRAVPHCTARQQRCVARGSLSCRVARCDLAVGSESGGEDLGGEGLVGRRRLLRCRAPLKLSSESRRPRRRRCYELKQTTQHVVFYSSERAKPAIRWTERYNSASHTLCCDHSAVNAAREALAITQAASVTPLNAARHSQ